MAASQTRDEGDYPPLANADNASPNTPSQEHPPTGPKRSLTPRGPLFLNLDEAHRNITSRLASNNPFRKPSGESQSTEEIPLTVFAIPKNIGDMRSANGLPHHATDFVLPHPSRRVAGNFLTHRREDAVGASGKDCLDTSDTSKSIEVPEFHTSQKSHLHDTSGSTVGQIVAQYAAESMSSSLASSDPAYTFSKAPPNNSFEPCPRDGAATRLGFRGEELRAPLKEIEKIQRRNSSLPPHSRSLRTVGLEQRHKLANRLTAKVNIGSLSSDDLNRLSTIVHTDPRPSVFLGEQLVNNPDMGSSHDLSTIVQPSSSPQRSSVGGLQEPLATTDGFNEGLTMDSEIQRDTCSLVPRPLRIPSNRRLEGDQREFEENRLDALFSDAESSVDENPFTDPSDADPFKYDNEESKRIRQLGKEREVSQALKHLTETHTECFLEHFDARGVERADGRDFVSDSEESEPNSKPPLVRGRHGGSFFDPVAFRALHGDVDHNHDHDIKVTINPKPEPAHDNEDELAKDTFGLAVEGNNLPPGRSRQNLATDGDWVTEATSDVGFGIVDTDVVRQGRQFDQGIKVTGSSIADYSDYGFDPLPKRLNSRNQILQHPSGDTASETYELRNLKDTKQTVFLPKSHVQRINGFAQNSIRLNPDIPKPPKYQDNSQRGGRLSNRFRRKSYRQADASSYFQYKTDRNAPSKYEFRDSTSEYAPAFNSNQAVRGTDETLASPSTASINTAELLDSSADPFTAGGGKSDSLSHAKTDSQRIKPMRTHSRRPAELLGGYQLTMTGDTDQPTPTTPIGFDNRTISAASKFQFPLLDLSEAQAIHKRGRKSGETDDTENYSTRDERAGSNTSSRPSQTRLLSRPSAVYVRNKSDVRKGSRLSLTFTPPDWQDLEDGDQGTPDQGEFTPLSSVFRPLFGHRNASQSPATPATCPDTDTPTIKKRGWFGQKSQYQKRLLPVDKRVRRAGSDRTLQSIMHSDIGPVQDTEDHCISYRARMRRQYFFYLMMTLCILPFFGLIVLAGHCDAALSYLTSGEVYRLTKRQRRAIQIVFAVECVIYGALVTGIAVYFGLNHRLST